MVDLHNHNGDEEWIKEQNNLEFLKDLTRELLSSRPKPSAANPASRNVSSCSYHHHQTEQLCYTQTASTTEAS